MLHKLAILVTAFVLALSAAAYASPLDRDGSGSEDGSGAAAAERIDLVGNEQVDQQFVLFIGPTQQEPEATPDSLLD